MRDIEKGLVTAKCSDNEKEELAFVISQAKQSIECWKAHLLRSVHQDECRLDILSGLSASSILLVLDWAMKYLPRKYRESQSDWFGKRGISWHVAVAIKNNSGEMEMMTFVHVFESAAAQDSSSVLAILNDVFIQLKTITARTADRIYSKRQRWMLSLHADPDYSSSDCQTSWPSDLSD